VQSLAVVVQAWVFVSAVESTSKVAAWAGLGASRTESKAVAVAANARILAFLATHATPKDLSLGIRSSSLGGPDWRILPLP
jgi:hypothetical protein